MPEQFHPQLYKDVLLGSKEWYSGLPVGQDPSLQVYYNDFLAEQDYAAADWTVTEQGTATQALVANALNGELLITNAASDNDSSESQATQENWKLQTGKKLWFECRVQTVDADQADIFLGLAVTDSTLIDGITDKIGFVLDDEDATLQASAILNSAETKQSTEKDMADATYVTVGFRWDGSSKVKFFVDREQTNEISTNIPNDLNLAISYAIQNGEATAQTMTIDYIYCAMER